MQYISIDEVKSKLGSYSKISNLVSSGELEICYRVNNYFASVDHISGLVHSIEYGNEIFIGESTEELKEVILGNKDNLVVSKTLNALKLKHVENQFANDKEKYKNFITPEGLIHTPVFKWAFLENEVRIQILKTQLENGKKIYEFELFPEHTAEYCDLEEACEKINFKWGTKVFSRDELFITTNSWNKYRRKPKTCDAIDRREENTKEDLYQLILILKHIITEESGVKDYVLNQQIRNLLVRGETTLNISKINDIFRIANPYKKTILKKNIINIFKKS
ncbi:hypothetical protein E0H80_15110 [Acinetobacter sp. ANC 4779]|uniref:hypothetical protein n=1 Tax=Acinetobacter sp. ANC 4779 TaxID=2529848 RepID=UPI00103F67F3|nr:hypothetical protein [Acinetobacter sp. ANC 4779]TCB48525.1 hypothetical protein E0H80_15110 [Acinetobacter sp. ANC 4779]